MTAIATKKWRRYSGYRPSGVDWLGEVPEGWEVKRLRFYMIINPTKAETRGLDGSTIVSFVPMEAVGIYGGLRLDQTKPIEEVATGYTYFRDGDVVIAKITPCFENGKGAIAEKLENGIGFGTTELHVLRPRADADRRYLFYLTLSHTFRLIGTAHMYGAGGQKRVPDDFIRDFRHPIPPIDIQRAIAAFLDQETARIDALIVKKERQIELLQEKRAALISHAVTKGLNPDVKMKPSGVEWLGEVPEGWGVKPLKRTFLIINGATPKSSESDYWDGDIPWATPDDLGSLQGDMLCTTRRMITCEGFESCGTSLAPAGSIILSTRAPIGYLALAGVSLCTNQGCRCLVFREEVEKRFYYYQLLTAKQELESWGQGSTFKELSRDKLAAVYLASPPLPEQRAIAAFLDRETGRIDTLREKIRASIEKLREFRTALISAAVTGKIDVREEVD